MAADVPATPSASRRVWYVLTSLLLIYPAFLLRDWVWQFGAAADATAIFRVLLARNLVDAILLGGLSVLLVRRFPFDVPITGGLRALAFAGLALAAGAFLLEGALVAGSLHWLPPEQALPPFWLVTRLAATGPEVTVLVMSVGLITPLVEEVFFRGMLYRSLAAVMPWWQAVLFSAAVFALLHVGSMVPVAFGLGCLAALAVERTGRLLPAVMLHSGLNCGFVAFNVNGSQFLRGDFAGICVYAAGGLAFLSVAGALLRRLPRAVSTDLAGNEQEASAA